ncbi:MAG: type I DNA topoisomerase [Chloroflexi bacterium]|nr:type I DNA topoisomerase [Chloroflexota bacterium]MYK34668.1 type I DNA topoisomerase [Chloroflexota bacterium]
MAKTPTTGRTSSRKRRAGNSAAQTSSAGNGRSTSRHLVIVESPAKAATIGRFLGRDYTVKASMGHVRDLPERKLGVNPDKDFIPWYEVPEDKRKVVDEIRAAGERAEDVYLATDPDREGEAIAWHVMEAAGWRSKPVRRVVFHSITEDAVKEAFAHERDIDMELVNAQQARRIEDRLVGFKLSPLLKPLVGQELNRNRNILTAEDLDTTSSLSAGRVQSVALRLVAERDKEIDAFVPVEYWSIDAALLTGENAAFTASLRSLVGEKDELSLPDEAAANAVLANLDGAAYRVDSVTTRQVNRRPAPPFITSTLQQEASRRLGFSATRTMAIAQQLYEGIAIGSEGRQGLITYMRTDSPQVTPGAIQETRRYIEERWGKDYVPRTPRRYTSRSKVAQEAHEAIRPTAIRRTPQEIRQHLTSEQARLYELIWNRMVASQMADAVLDSTRVDVRATASGKPAYLFRATGSVVRFAGFRALYIEQRDEGNARDGEDDDSRVLPPLQQGQPLDCTGLTPEQHFTQPPPRFTEASLVRALEEQGIGRPSTYAAIINTLVNRKYVTRDRRVLRSTNLGKLVCEQLISHFPDIMDISFTGRMEDQLDEVANGKQEWIAFLHDFYGPFSEDLSRARKAIKEATQEAASESTNEPCDVCGRPMIVRLGRFGAFLSCTGYPDCKNSRDIPRAAGDSGEQSDNESEETCDLCGKPMALRRGRFGPFYACTGYPECKNTRRLPKAAPRDTGVPCPRCGGNLVERRGRRGPFYGCSNFPTCNFLVNRQPLPQPCPECDGLMVVGARQQANCTNCAWKGPLPAGEPASVA